MALAQAGVDVEGASVPYVAGWASHDPEVIERDAHEIDRIAARLEAALESESAGEAVTTPLELYLFVPDRRMAVEDGWVALHRASSAGFPCARMRFAARSSGSRKSPERFPPTTAVT